jgi:hypothetical protein
MLLVLLVEIDDNAKWWGEFGPQSKHDEQSGQRTYSNEVGDFELNRDHTEARVGWLPDSSLRFYLILFLHSVSPSRHRKLLLAYQASS